MRVFREMCRYIRHNQQFVTGSEMKFVTAKVSEISVQVTGILDWKKKIENDIVSIQKSIETLRPVIDKFILVQDKQIVILQLCP